MDIRDLIKEFGDSNENWLILEHLTKKTVDELKINQDSDVNYIYDEFEKIIKKRKEGYPLQYIFGKWEFYGLELYVDESALIPRFETEILVDEILKFKCKKDKILDIGTGTGAIALALASNLKNSKILGIDISEKAIGLANKNKIKLDVNNVNFVISNLFQNVTERFDLIVSNPPYIDSDEIKTLDRELYYEPQNALYGGTDGLYFYREIVKNSSDYLNEKGVLAFEIGYNQMEIIEEMLIQNNFEVILKMKDFAGFDRIIVGRKKS